MSPSTAPLPRATEERDDRFPPGIPYIVGNEGAERFSFYGMRQILFIYLTSLFLGFAPESTVGTGAVTDATLRATQTYHLFNASVYLFPMIGAILADRLLGKYRVIFWVSLVYCAGQAALSFGGHLGAQGHLSTATAAVYAGLILIAIGSGGIKPCVSANVGDQFTSKNAHLVQQIFQIFYFIINFGSFFASVLTPVLYKSFGAAVAFGVPGVLMALATFVFWLGGKRSIQVPPAPGGRLGLLDFLASSFLCTPLLVMAYVGTTVADEIVKAAMSSEAGAVGRAILHIVEVDWPYALAALLGLGIGAALFAWRQRIKQDNGFFAVLLYCFQRRREPREGGSFWSPARTRFGEEAAEGPPAVLRIIVVFSMVGVFWALFDQNSSTWVQQAKMMNLTLVVPTILWYGWLIPAVVVAACFGAVWLFTWISNRPLPRKVTITALTTLVLWGALAAALQAIRGGTERIDLLPAQVSAFNPLMVMLIIPGLDFLVYRPLDRRGKPLKPLTRMAIGMFLAAGAFVTVALIQMRIASVGPGKVHVLWQVIPFFILTTSEVLVSVTGLEFAYTQAPRAMKSTIMGFWLICVTLGNVLVAFLAPLETLSGGLATFFWTFAGLMLVAALVFVALASTYKGRSYLQA